MGPGSLRLAIVRKSPMLLHRLTPTGCSIFAKAGQMNMATMVHPTNCHIATPRAALLQPAAGRAPPVQISSGVVLRLRTCSQKNMSTFEADEHLRAPDAGQRTVNQKRTSMSLSMYQASSSVYPNAQEPLRDLGQGSGPCQGPQ